MRSTMVADEPAQQEKPQRGSSPHCGYPGKFRNWYSNLSGVLTVEHPVPKMDSVRLPNSDLLCTVSQGWACTGASSTKLPAAASIADQSVGPFVLETDCSAVFWRSELLQSILDRSKVLKDRVSRPSRVDAGRGL